jgi:hypothetical protein
MQVDEAPERSRQLGNPCRSSNAGQRSRLGMTELMSALVPRACLRQPAYCDRRGPQHPSAFFRDRSTPGRLKFLRALATSLLVTQPST